MQVLVVDNTVSTIEILQSTIQAQSDFRLVGTVHSITAANAFLQQHTPDVIALNMHLTESTNVEGMARLVSHQACPVVAVSANPTGEAVLSLKALSMGAVDFVFLKTGLSGAQHAHCAESVAHTLRAAARSVPRRVPPAHSSASLPGVPSLTFSHWKRKLKSAGRTCSSVSSIIALGASTGGPVTLQRIIQAVTLRDSAAVIVQHMPTRFIGKFASRLDRVASVPVLLAEDGAAVQAGHCYVAPGDHHLRLERSGGDVIWALDTSAPVCGHQPSVDVLFSSIARTAGHTSVGVLLTGMGRDGADGLLRMREAGGVTMAQDEQSSAVWGMPGAAMSLGAADTALTPDDIAHAISEIS